MSVDELARQVRAGLEYLNFPRREWVVQKACEGRKAHDVVIVGGGQSGLAAAFGLRLENIKNVAILDRGQPGGIGPWTTFARMKTLRTPKWGSGLDFGNPMLTPQAWYTARFGEQAWEELGKMPTALWHEYLEWYRRTLALPVEYGAEVARIEPAQDLLAVRCTDGRCYHARRVILATGLNGSGRWHVPQLAQGLSRRLYAHTEEAIDFSTLKGKRVGVLGGGASAFDNAATALEAGASCVELCIRAPQLPRINPNKWMEFSGFLGHYGALRDDMKWRFMSQIASMLQPPPQETLWRCNRHEAFRLRVGSPWESARQEGDAVVVQTPKARLAFDFVIFGTGLEHNLAARAELAGLHETIALWQDRYTPAPDLRNEHMAKAPYLGEGFEFMSKTPGEAPYLERIHNFTHGAMVSLGLNAASITGMKYGVRRLVGAVARSLFVEDAQAHFDALTQYAEQEIWTLEPEASALAAR